MFVNQREGEKIGFDFKAFFILLNINDKIYLHGKKTVGHLEKKEFLKFLDDKSLSPITMKLIDLAKTDYTEE
jgi:hypothetical protein